MMNINFKTRVIDGKNIVIPAKLRKKLKGKSVQVSLFTVEQPPVPAKDYIEYLLENPIQCETFKPMTRDEIYADR